ncbi:MAG TPA: hypothetical protein VK428_02645, partial [Acidimicrobiales bacterium]|nr:hypothetical protein [Acidimicrobiales bacterium]
MSGDRMALPARRHAHRPHPRALLSRRRAGEEGQAGLLTMIGALVVLITIPLALQLQASDQAPTSQQAVYGQAALSAAEAGVQDYIDHLEAAGPGYVAEYCSSNYFPGNCSADPSDKAFRDDAPTASVNDATDPASVPGDAWVTQPTSNSATGTPYDLVESYYFLVDTDGYNATPAAGSYTDTVAVYATGRAGAPGLDPHYVYRRVKATIAVPVTSTVSYASGTLPGQQPPAQQTPPGFTPSQTFPPQKVTFPPSASQAVAWAVNPCASTSAWTNPNVSVPSGANYAVISLAGAAGAAGGTTIADSSVTAGGAGAAFTAAVPVTAGDSLDLVAACAGQGAAAGANTSENGSAGGASECGQTGLCGKGIFLGGIGGGGGGASAVFECSASPCTSSGTPLAVAGGGGGGGDATVALSSGAGGGAGGLAQCTSASGCSASGVPVTSAGNTVGYVMAGTSGGSATCGGGGGGGGSWSSTGTGGAGSGGSPPGGVCGWLGTGKAGGSGGASDTSGTDGSPASD